MQQKKISPAGSSKQTNQKQSTLQRLQYPFTPTPQRVYLPFFSQYTTTCIMFQVLKCRFKVQGEDLLKDPNIGMVQQGHKCRLSSSQNTRLRGNDTDWGRRNPLRLGLLLSLSPQSLSLKLGLVSLCRSNVPQNNATAYKGELLHGR